MKPGPETNLATTTAQPAGKATAGTPESRSIDRVIRWCLVSFIASSVILGAIAWYAVRTNQVGAYMNVAGIVYVVFSTFFLGVIAWVFFYGHVGSSGEIEAPKMELFDIEKRR